MSDNDLKENETNLPIILLIGFDIYMMKTLLARCKTWRDLLKFLEEVKRITWTFKNTT